MYDKTATLAMKSHHTIIKQPKTVGYTFYPIQKQAICAPERSTSTFPYWNYHNVLEKKHGNGTGQTKSSFIHAEFF